MTIEKLNLAPEVILEWIRLYNKDQVPTTEIAKRYKVSVATVQRKFNHLGIKRRVYGFKYDSRAPKRTKLNEHKDEIIKLYTVEKWNLVDVGKKFGVCMLTVSSALKIWNVPLRTSGPVSGKKRGPYKYKKKTGAGFSIIVRN